MTKDPDIRICFKTDKCIITKGQTVIATGTKGSDNFYLVDDADDYDDYNEEIHQAAENDDEDSQGSESKRDEFLN